MKRILVLAVLISMATSVTADGHGSRAHDMPYGDEVEEILEEYRDREIGSMTFGEMKEMAGRLSVPYQKARYVRSAAFKSYLMPGLGQFAVDSAGSGTLFVLGHLAIKAGTAVGAYVLLPESVTFSNLDYINASGAEIESAWKSLSLADIAPAVGVAAGGMLVDHFYRMLAAKHAKRLARSRVDSGQVEFEPELSLLEDGTPVLSFAARF